MSPERQPQGNEQILERTMAEKKKSSSGACCPIKSRVTGKKGVCGAGTYSERRAEERERESRAEEYEKPPPLIPPRDSE